MLTVTMAIGISSL